MNEKLRKIWDDFCRQNHIADEGKPLFECVGGRVSTKEIGWKPKHKVLVRSSEVDIYLIKTAVSLREDYDGKDGKYEGILYLMFRKQGRKVVPLYIGKTEKIGRKGELSNLLKGSSPKPRWDDGPDYHIGGLSTCVCPGYTGKRVKKHYRTWATSLFLKTPSGQPRLRHKVFLWLRLWKVGEVGLWRDFGATSLCLQETLLINVAHVLHPDDLLNTEGILR